MGVSTKEYRSESLKDINESFNLHLTPYVNEENKDFRISIVNNTLDQVKRELSKSGLSNTEKIDLINFFQELSRILERLNNSGNEEFITQNSVLEEDPAYHLHKKSQSAFGKVE
ncbi:hypothetical protein [Emticicia sp. 21SJ11W-3]|uniref:hypothetical protein n=1 Tax=Emticicia sp. 21SJ11W-3 TaxID=2916755 RepID=UPI00209CB26C|nr:hypothetical protein [Emticicia sp. 21SJ11W-3]UTA67871.1 hypothetical protein MB380_20070 [Emticicia sp. 21SJ11W-3]